LKSGDWRRETEGKKESRIKSQESRIMRIEKRLLKSGDRRPKGKKSQESRIKRIEKRLLKCEIILLRIEKKCNKFRKP